MTEDEFITGLGLYYAGVNPWGDELNAWTTWILGPAYPELFREIIIIDNRPSAEKALALFQLYNSPLMKALR